MLDQAKLLTKFFLEWLHVSEIVISDDLQDVKANNLKIILSPLFQPFIYIEGMDLYAWIFIIFITFSNSYLLLSQCVGI